MENISTDYELFKSDRSNLNLAFIIIFTHKEIFCKPSVKAEYLKNDVFME